MNQEFPLESAKTPYSVSMLRKSNAFAWQPRGENRDFPLLDYPSVESAGVADNESMY